MAKQDDETVQGSRTRDAELTALTRIVAILEPLDIKVRARIVSYVLERYFPDAVRTTRSTATTGPKTLPVSEEDDCA